MAITQNPIIGASRGKLANVTFSKWKNKNVLKSKPIVVSNPRSSLQVGQRTRHSFLVMFARLVIPIIKLSMKELAISMSEYNYYIQANSNNVVVSPSGTASMLLPTMILSRGSLQRPVPLSYITVIPNNIQINISTSSNGTTGLGTDIVYSVLYNPILHEFAFSSIITNVNAGNTQVGHPPSWATHTVHAYIYRLRPQQGKASDTVYCGVVVCI